MKLDRDGKEFIKSFESLSLTPYTDIHGKWTIGWGHTLGITSGSPPISRMQADCLFDEDVEDAEEPVNKFVMLEIKQNEFNALVSFAFNEGYGKFKNSTLLRKLNMGDRAGAAKEFLRWVYYEDPKTKVMKVSKGLTARREAEQKLFLKEFNRARGEV